MLCIIVKGEEGQQQEQQARQFTRCVGECFVKEHVMRGRMSKQVASDDDVGKRIFATHS